jgi:hypothetical protein
MPYANFDDMNSLQAVYNNYLQEENDSNVFEFIGEKILSAGFIYDNDQQKLPVKHPFNNTIIVQIHGGVLFRQSAQEAALQIFPVLRIVQPLINSVAYSQEFHPGIFHPPLIAA